MRAQRMTIIVNVHEAKTHFSKLLDRANAGEEIIVAKAGKPYARLVPLAVPAKPRKAGALKHLFKGQPSDEIFAPFSNDELAAWGS
jgi:prevent-host-death family protein